MSERGAMIELTDVHKVYRHESSPVHALDSIDLCIEAGEHVALLGPSGSGKSTLMHIIGCLDRPTQGTYRFAGRDVGSLDVNRLADIRNREIGFVFQSFNLLPHATASENVALPLKVAGVRRAARLAQADEMLDRVGLGDRRTHRPTELSGGQQQRVAVARALINHPSVLLADEPTGNLDSAAGRDIVELLEELRAEGRTLIVVTHDESIAERAPRVIRLLDGRVA